MAQWPADLKSEYKIGFGYEEMPDQTENLLNYKEAASLTPPGGSIWLPLPAQMEDSTQHTWNLTKGLGAAVKSLAFEAGSATANLTTLGTAGALKDSIGLNVDPNHFYTYQQSEPRAFTYSVNMIPRNSEEAKNIMEIVKLFKKYSSPIKGTFVRNFRWSIIIGNEQLANAMNFTKHAWVLVAVSSNYTGAGSALFFDDGMPKQVNLTLTFNEMSTMYTDDWD